MEEKSHKMKMVYTITEGQNGKKFWTKIGVGFVNQDGSINLKLDAIPVGGQGIQVREYEPFDPARANGGGARPPRSLRDPSREPFTAPGPLAEPAFGGL